MGTFAERRNLVVTIAALATVQSGFGVMRALHWFDIGSDLMGQGLLILPLVGVLAVFRGGLITAIALLYVAFACGVVLQRTWSFWFGLVGAVVNLLLVFSVIGQGEPIGQAVLWAVVPVVILLYLLSGAGPRTMTGTKI
jgi:hypothetical protein